MQMQSVGIEDMHNHNWWNDHIKDYVQIVSHLKPVSHFVFYNEVTEIMSHLLKKTRT